MSLSLAQRGSTSLTYYSSALPHREPGERKGEEAEADRYPLIMAVRVYCVWEKVVIEVGASPWR